MEKMARKRKGDPDKAIINHDISFQIIKIALFDSHSQMKTTKKSNSQSNYDQNKLQSLLCDKVAKKSKE